MVLAKVKTTSRVCVVILDLRQRIDLTTIVVLLALYRPITFAFDFASIEFLPPFMNTVGYLIYLFL